MRSMSRSHRSFTTQPAARITTAPMPNSTISRTASRGAGPDSRMPHSPGRNSSQMPIGRSSRASSRYGSQGRGRRATQPVAAMSVCARMAATLRSVMTRVNPPTRYRAAWPRAARSPHGRAGALSRDTSCAAVQARGCCCSTAVTANSAPASRPSGAMAPACTPSTAHGTRSEEPDLWLAFALLKRDATDLVVQKATELGVAASAPCRHRAWQHAPDERGSPRRHRNRGRRAVRASDGADAARTAIAHGSAVRLATGAPPVRRHRAQQRGTHCAGARTRARFSSARKAASRRRSLKRCGRIPL